MLSAPPVPLSTLLGQIEAALGPDASDGAWLLRIQSTSEGVTLGLLPLDGEAANPVEALLGFRADPSWSAAGLICHGRARTLAADGPGSPPRRIRAIHAVTIEGEEASLLRFLDEERAPLDPGPAEGRLTDCCKRILGLPTAAPPTSILQWFGTAWLSAVLGRCASQPTKPLGWRRIVALHPAATLGYVRPDRFAAHVATEVSHLSWEGLRRQFESGTASYGDLGSLPRPLLADLSRSLTPEVAGWMDEGFFARWLISSLPDPVDLVVDLADLLPHEDFESLLEVLRAWDMW